MPEPATPIKNEKESPRRLGRAGQRRVALGALVTTVLASGVWLLIGQAASYSRLWSAVQKADAGWLIISLVASVLGYLGYALVYQAVSRVRGGPRPHLSLALRMTIAVFGAAVVATAAGRLGSEYWSMRRMQQTRATAWARVLTLNIVLWAVLGLLAWTGALISLIAGVPHVPLAVELAWLLAAPGCTVGTWYVSSPRRHHMIDTQGGRIRRSAAAVVHSLVLLRSLIEWRPPRSRALLGGLIYWAGQLIVMWAAARAFGTHIGYAPLILGYTTGYATSVLPLPVGGAGGVDAAIIYALTLVGVPLGVALLATLVQRLFTYWLPLAVAVASARLIRHLGADLEAVMPPAPAP